MAKILFVWELGLGLGHTMPIKQFCESLQKEHELFVALKNIERSSSIFCGVDVKVLQAPIRQKKLENTAIESQSYAHLLHNVGFSDSEFLKDVVLAWHNIYELVGPDLVVFDHSPFALVAARKYDFKKIVSGLCFACPPISKPLGLFFPKSLGSEALNKLVSFEDALVEKINNTVVDTGIKAIEQLSDIYKDVDETLLSAVNGLDSFDVRAKEKYIGIPTFGDGEDPKWPSGTNRKVFLYSHGFANIEILLQLLDALEFSTLVYSSSIPKAFLEQFSGENIHIANMPQDLKLVSESCDFVITNSNYNTTVQMALHGVPQICFPLHVEQLMFANTLMKTGASITVMHADKKEIVEKVQLFVENYDYHKDSAIRLKNKYGSRSESDVVFSQEVSSLMNASCYP